MNIEQVETNAQLDNLNNPSSGVDYGELILPTAFTDAMSLEQQIFWLLVHKEDRLRAGDNITLTKNQDGTVTVSATGGGGSGSTYRIDEVEPDEGYAAAYALIDIATGTQSGETIQIPEGGQGPQGDPGVGISSIVGEVGTTGTTVTVTLTDESTQTFFVERGVAGQDGNPGQPGQDGTDGVSPEVTITSITDGHRVTITDADHPLGQSFDVMNGQDGSPGQSGQDGVSPEVTITSITDGHRVTITDADHPQGQSFDVEDGQDGAPGQPGQDGVTPNISASATVGTGTGTPSVQVTKSGTTVAPEFTFAFDGLKGTQGASGQSGQDGVSPEVTITSITDGHRVTITDADHPLGQSFDVMDGQDGQNGQDGQDGAAATIQVGTVTTGQPGTNASVTNSGTSSAAVLDFTIPAGAAGATGPAGPGVPPGGTANQILSKVDGTDYNTEWVTPSSGGGGVEIVTDNTHALITTTLYVKSTAGNTKSVTVSNLVCNFNLAVESIASPATYTSYKLVKPINFGTSEMSRELFHLNLTNAAGESVSYAYLDNQIGISTAGTNALALLSQTWPHQDAYVGGVFFKTSSNLAKAGTYNLRFNGNKLNVNIYMDLSGLTLANNESITLYFY